MRLLTRLPLGGTHLTRLDGERQSPGGGSRPPSVQFLLSTRGGRRGLQMVPNHEEWRWRPFC